MKRLFSKATASILAIAVCATAGPIIKAQNKTLPTPDIKIRQRMTTGGASAMETVLYVARFWTNQKRCPG